MCLTSQLLTPEQFFDLTLEQLNLLEHYLEGHILSTPEIRNQVGEKILTTSNEAFISCDAAVQLLPNPDMRNRLQALANGAYTQMVPARKISKR